MAGNLLVTIIGELTIIDAMEQLDKDTQAFALKAIIDATNFCADMARSTVPVDTGALQNSEYVLFAELESEVGFMEDYAPYVELGTYKIAAQPYLIPSLELAKVGLLSHLDHLI